MSKNKHQKKQPQQVNRINPTGNTTASTAGQPNKLENPALEKASQVGTCWHFSALDTLFFRESRPMESIGGAQLQSVFPPPARTVMGAVRTAIGQAQGINWHDFPHQPEHQALRELIGDADDMGCLSFQGPYLLKDGQRLYPAPLVLLKATQKNKGGADETVFTRLVPSSSLTDCDLGRVALPKMQLASLQGAKPLEQVWLTKEGLKVALEGRTPAANQVVDAKALFDSEERLGIGRDNATRTTGNGLLYQTQHVRPKSGVAIGMVVNGLEGTPPLPASGFVRLGAEGRLAHWERREAVALPPAQSKNQRLLVVLMTHARFDNGWLPDGFEKTTLDGSDNGQTVWRGQLHGVALRLMCAVVGKSVREGGWDLVNRSPRPVQALVPAGSAYFFEVESGQAHELQALHGSQIGQDTSHGRGEISIGIW
jgi:CRISPR-associated protein Cmr3